MSSRLISVSFAAAVMAMCLSALGDTFQGVGDFSGKGSGVSGVSGDGTTVVGSSDNRAFRWRAGVMQDLGTTPAFSNPDYDYDRVGANAVSYDGSVVVGGASLSFYGYDVAPFRWTAGEGMVKLSVSTNYATASAVSADGTVSVGYDWVAGPFRHCFGSPSTYQDLPIVSGSSYPSAFGVSGDGSIVVGHGGMGPSFKWVVGSPTAEALNAPSGWNASPCAYGISANGQVIVGSANAHNGHDYAVLWTSSGCQALPHVQAEADDAAYAASYDGSLVVGTESYSAVIWDAAHGSRRLEDVLQSAGLDLTGWSINAAVGVSYDGSVIVGNGYHNGHAEGWIATGNFLGSNPVPALTPLPESGTPVDVGKLRPVTGSAGPATSAAAVTLSNTGDSGSTLSITVSVTGANASLFHVSNATLPAVLDAGAAATPFDLLFDGGAPGIYTATVTFNGDNGQTASYPVTATVLYQGDANEDGKVSFADYIALANNFGQTGAAWTMGDFNGDGKVSFADYILLANNFGQHVPEPATLGLLLIGGQGLIRRKK